MICFSFLCYFTYFVTISFTKIILLLLFIFFVFHENYFYSFMFQNVPCSGFIDAQAWRILSYYTVRLVLKSGQLIVN